MNILIDCLLPLCDVWILQMMNETCSQKSYIQKLQTLKLTHLSPILFLYFVKSVEATPFPSIFDAHILLQEACFSMS
jgi:hypothetical protein